MTTGIHHVTGITRRVQANVDFYVGFLGLRLVKRTAGYEDSEQLHLFYGDALGSPGSLITFLVWEDGAPGRVGIGQVAEIALAVPPDSIGEWLTRGMQARIPMSGPMREFGETVLRLKDPDGITIKLVGVDLPALAPLPDPIAPTRLRGVTLFSDKPAESGAFLTHFGYVSDGTEDNLQRFRSDSDIVDIRDATGYFPGIPGTGVLDHVAFRARDVDDVRSTRLKIGHANPTSVHDRKYFLSLYLRDPAEILLEYATDNPGMTVDESAGDLGAQLFVPPHDTARAEDLRIILPQFALPGDERTVMRTLHFVHRFHHPAEPDGMILVLLHGTGGNEADLMPIAHRIAPHATLLGVRGRSTEEGVSRWFRRLNAVTFDQADIRAEAEAFVAFIDEASVAYGLPRERMIFLGYSNGANLLGAILHLLPSSISRAILLRPAQVLNPAPEATGSKLSSHNVLMVNGTKDPYSSLAADLAESLRRAGADVDSRNVAAGHELSPEDVRLAQDWLRQLP